MSRKRSEATPPRVNHKGRLYVRADLLGSDTDASKAEQTKQLKELSTKKLTHESPETKVERQYPREPKMSPEDMRLAEMEPDYMDFIENGLRTLQASYAVLYQKLRHYHWDVYGDLFFELHLKFNELYDAAAVNVDNLAERVKGLGGTPVPTMQEMLDLSVVGEDPSITTHMNMVSNVIADMNALTDYARECASVARSVQDYTTADLLDGIMAAQEKTVWMLRQFSTPA